MKLRRYGMGAARALLISEVVVAVCGLTLVVTTGLSSAVSRESAAQAAVPAQPRGGAGAVAADSGVSRYETLSLSPAEFGAALRAGEVSFGAWDPASKSFLVELTEADAARLRSTRAGGS